jgi:16S rRNA (uracil1498-N3)-methyltransferase
MRSLPRFFLSDYEYAKGKYYLREDRLLKHARKVLRIEKGDKVILFDGKGTSYLSEVELLSKEVMVAKVIEKKIEDIPERPEITLAQGLPKAGKIDTILRMNTEIGVSKFVLFESDYSVVKVKHYDEKKMLRLGKVVQEASRQSVNNFIPEIPPASSFDELLNLKADYKLILHTESKGKKSIDIKEIKEKIKPDDRIVICIGPEGGFSDHEIKSAIEKGFQLVKLDLPVLRTETAGLVASSFLLI